MGSKALGLRCLAEMHDLNPQSIKGIVTIDDSDDIRSELGEFKKFAKDKNLNLHIVKNNKETESIIKTISPDICFVVGWYRIIKKGTLEAVPGGFLGIHHSLLPKYRGGSPLVWAMINGEKSVGTSLFSFTEGMDEGDIWAQEEVAVGDNDYISDILVRLEEKAIAILREKYTDILDGKLKPRSQNHNEATFCSSRTPDDGLIDWNKNAKEIYDFIRAQSEPYPGAFTFLDGKKLVIWRTRPDNRIYYGRPGQVAERSADSVSVICGDNRPITLETVGLDGVKYPAGEIVKSIKTRLGNQ